MHLEQTLWISLVIVGLVALLQWWATGKIHRKRIASVRARHVKSQQDADKMLQQSRHQNLQLQQELAAARLAMKRAQREPAPPVKPALMDTRDARDALMKILDESPHEKRKLPVDGFAETMPSLQFQPSSL